MLGLGPNKHHWLCLIRDWLPTAFMISFLWEKHECQIQCHVGAVAAGANGAPIDESGRTEAVIKTRAYDLVRLLGRFGFRHRCQSK